MATLARTINGNYIYAQRSDQDAAGNTISTTYATKSEVGDIDAVPEVTSTEAGKILKASYDAQTGGSYAWEDDTSELPAITGKANKVLKVNSGATGVEWADDENTTYTFSTGLTESSGTVTVTNPVPTTSSADSGKVLGCTDSAGTLGWVSQPAAVTIGTVDL